MSKLAKDKSIDKIDIFKKDIRFKKKIEHIETIPSKKARYKKVDKIDKKLLKYFEEKDIKLYEHQALSLEKARENKNIIITTPTASGKTLSFNLPVLEELIKDNDACALYIYPAKALSYDQLKVLKNFEKELNIDIKPNPYDGDTPKLKRYNIRRESRVILSNPYQLHHILSWHHQWKRFYSNLKYIVIDEAHYYKGIFGSNVAFLIRRLKRIAKFYGSNPKFILSSATLANPLELAEKLTGEKFELIDNDASPSGEKDFILYNPYKKVSYNPEDESNSVHHETERIFLYLLLKDIQTLCFTSSRKIAELIALWARNDMNDIKQNYVDRISAYRAGYLAEDRRKIEDGLKSREYLGVTSTNALELGIDVGTLDAVIISGFPGSMISTWQQGGRAGRGNQKSLVILVAFQNQLDQYFMNNPKFFFDKPHENVVIDLNNEKLIHNHMICAANELPLTDDEIKTIFNVNNSFVEKLLNSSKDLKKSPTDIYIYPYDDSPSFRFSLNQISNEVFTVINNKKIIEKLEIAQMYREAHEGAVLINKGQTYIVNSVNFNTHQIDVVKKDVNAHTVALKETNIKIIKKIKKYKIGDFIVNYGELDVEEKYSRYKRMQYSKVLGTYPLDLPPLNFKTKGLWFTIPNSFKEELEEKYNDNVSNKEIFAGGLHGTEHALIGLFPLHVMCDRLDIGGLSTNYHIDTQEASIFIYDAYEGGIGICEKAMDVFRDLTKSTLDLLKNCNCKYGCPSCIYSPKCGNENKPLDKNATKDILNYMWEKMTILSPEDIKIEDQTETKTSNETNIINTDSNDDEEYSAALIEFEKENYSISKEILTNIIIKKDSADAYYLIGKILNIQKDNNGALSFVKKALSINPTHEEANEFYYKLKNDIIN